MKLFFTQKFIFLSILVIILGLLSDLNVSKPPKDFNPNHNRPKPKPIEPRPNFKKQYPKIGGFIEKFKCWWNSDKRFDDCFFNKQTKCPENHLFKNGKCVKVVDFGLITFICFFVTGTVFFILSISLLILSCSMLRKCLRKLKCCKCCKRCKSCRGSKKNKKNNLENHNITSGSINSNENNFAHDQNFSENKIFKNIISEENNNNFICRNLNYPKFLPNQARNVISNNLSESIHIPNTQNNLNNNFITSINNHPEIIPTLKRFYPIGVSNQTSQFKINSNVINENKLLGNNDFSNDFSSNPKYKNNQNCSWNNLINPFNNEINVNNNNLNNNISGYTKIDDIHDNDYTEKKYNFSDIIGYKDIKNSIQNLVKKIPAKNIQLDEKFIEKSKNSLIQEHICNSPIQVENSKNNNLELINVNTKQNLNNQNILNNIQGNQDNYNNNINHPEQSKKFKKNFFVNKIIYFFENKFI